MFHNSIATSSGQKKPQTEHKREILHTEGLPCSLGRSNWQESESSSVAKLPHLTCFGKSHTVTAPSPSPPSPSSSRIDRSRNRGRRVDKKFHPPHPPRVVRAMVWLIFIRKHQHQHRVSEGAQRDHLHIYNRFVSFQLPTKGLSSSFVPFFFLGAPREK